MEDWYAFALQQPQITSAGQTFRYGSGHLMAFGALMTARIGGDPLDWLEERVLDPIGFRYAGWTRDPAGSAMWPYSVWTTAAEWMRFGGLLRDDGMWRESADLP